MRPHRTALRLAVLAAAAAAWAGDRHPGGWTGLGASQAAVAALLLLLASATFFTGPAWWVALATDRMRAGHRYRRAHPPPGRKPAGRPAIPARVRRITYFADRGRCVYCRSAGPLAWDHHKPWDRGGLTSLHNGFTLCAHHNTVKSDAWVYPRGRAYYNPCPGFSAEHLAQALDILRVERARRRSPVRLARLAAGILLA